MFCVCVCTCVCVCVYVCVCICVCVTTQIVLGEQEERAFKEIAKKTRAKLKDSVCIYNPKLVKILHSKEVRVCA